MGTQNGASARSQELRTKIPDGARSRQAEGLRRGHDAENRREDRVPPTAIYQHFQDKDALVAELCRHDSRGFAAHFAAAAATEDPVSGCAPAGAYFAFSPSNSLQHYRLMFMAALTT
jgi:hypothetical protein